MLLPDKTNILVYALVTSFFLYLSTTYSSFAAETSWQITTGHDISRTHIVKPKRGTVFNLSRLYYDVRERMFLLDMARLDKAALDAGKTKPSHHIIYIIQPETGQERWLQTLHTEDAFNKEVFSLPPFAKTLHLNSAVLRKSGQQSQKQPFGDHRVVLNIKEKPYKKKKMSSGILFNDLKWHTEMMGKGFVTLDILDPQGETVFSLRDNYKDNSEEYNGYWSPDGRYFFIVLPANSSSFGGIESFSSYNFMIVGPFQTKANISRITANLFDKRQALLTKQEEQKPHSGIITTQDLYGSMYVSARTKALSCKNLLAKTGEIKSLTIKDRGHALNFGNPVIVGKSFIFHYESEQSRGNIKVSAIKPEYREQWGDKYKNYLETINVEADSGNYHVSCP